MLYHILFPLADQFAVLNVFRYLTFRTGGAIITALIISFLFGPVLINILKTRQNVGQPIREDGPEGHLLTKKGTPTMGGACALNGGRQWILRTRLMGLRRAEPFTLRCLDSIFW